MKLKMSTAFFVVLASVITAASATASPCGGQILQFEQAMQQRPDLVATAPQSIDAQLEHQPTPSSVAQAEATAKGNVLSALDKAKALDAEGQDGECLVALARARILLQP